VAGLPALSVVKAALAGWYAKLSETISIDIVRITEACLTFSLMLLPPDEKCY
jgi:hypothetical protein